MDCLRALNNPQITLDHRQITLDDSQITMDDPQITPNDVQITLNNLQITLSVGSQHRDIVLAVAAPSASAAAFCLATRRSAGQPPRRFNPRKY